MTAMKPKFKKKERGFITLDFLIAFVLVMGFTSILAALTVTLTVVEVIQYTSFATARNFSVSHIDTDAQVEYANQTYQRLYNNPAVASLFRNGWFEISEEPQIGNFIDDFPASDTESGVYFGARVRLNSKVLAFEIPFFGSTTNDETEEGFQTALSSYVGKEPTQAECQQFSQNRLEWTRSLNGTRFSETDSSNARAFMDNGC